LSPRTTAVVLGQGMPSRLRVSPDDAGLLDSIVPSKDCENICRKSGIAQLCNWKLTPRLKIASRSKGTSLREPFSMIEKFKNMAVLLITYKRNTKTSTDYDGSYNADRSRSQLRPTLLPPDRRRPIPDYWVSNTVRFVQVFVAIDRLSTDLSCVSRSNRYAQASNEN
jgi:hypothetical protein